MMRALIVRPFGCKEGIDFPRVQQLLIDPALQEIGVRGATTEELVGQGNIRADLFERLLKYDLVVADISIDNANVFYELGVRHALRDRHTFLIRARRDGGSRWQDEVPFDLRTDRYLEYDQDAPQNALPLLIKGLHQTLDSDKPDSPVFQLVSGLQAQDWTSFVGVPRDFTEEVAEAARRKRNGDLDLLASEVDGLEWELLGLKPIGRELFALRFNQSAKAVWERVVAIKDDDAEAWGRLASIYQRLGDFTKSERALDRVIDFPALKPEDRAKLYALRGSHERRRWTEDWSGSDDLNERRRRALASPHLVAACQAFEEAFKSDLNYGYAGLNALALLAVRAELAGSAELAGDWSNLFETRQQASDKLRDLRDRRRDLEIVVRCTLEAAKAKGDKGDKGDRRDAAHGDSDVWTAVSMAELRCLMGKKPEKIASDYGEALIDQHDFDFESVREKLRIFDRLGLLGAGPAAALAKIDEIERKLAGTTVQSGLPEPARVLLFSGHMIDAPGRDQPRFPAGAETTVRQWLRDAIAQQVASARGAVLGIAGGACGGDILFHEVCAEFKPGVFARLYLSVPPELFVPDSVAKAGGIWVERFYRLYPRDARPAPRILSASKQMPRWLRDKPDYGPWQRNNAWMLCNALVFGVEKIRLIALWDGLSGDGAGGTADMVQLARSRGIEVIHLDTRKLSDR